jgi:hypothetical protein
MCPARRLPAHTTQRACTHLVVVDRASGTASTARTLAASLTASSPELGELVAHAIEEGKELQPDHWSRYIIPHALVFPGVLVRSSWRVGVCLVEWTRAVRWLAGGRSKRSGRGGHCAPMRRTTTRRDDNRHTTTPAPPHAPVVWLDPPSRAVPVVAACPRANRPQAADPIRAS